MKSSAGQAGRKWPFGRPGLGRPPRGSSAALVTAATALLALLALMDNAAARKLRPLDLFEGRPMLRGSVQLRKVPLPRPRPEQAPGARPETPAEAKAAPAGPPAAPEPSACRERLTEDIAIAPSIPDIQGPGGCGGTDLVRLEAIVLPDRRRVAVTPAATLRCTMASAVVDWVRTDLVPLASGLGSEISGLDNFDSYECRGRNRVAGAQLSEHGRANALDVRAFTLADGQSIALTDRDVPRELRERMLHSACARFATVLGPGSDGYHEDHIHLDLMERHNNYRICQWDVLDPLPKIAPLLPRERPDQAPPREVLGNDGPDESGPAAGAPQTRQTKKRR